MQLDLNKSPESSNNMKNDFKAVVTPDRVRQPKLQLADKVANSKESLASAVSNNVRGIDFVGIAG